LLVALSIGATWSVARGEGDKASSAQQETYTPTVEEWLQVWTNANFGRNDGRHTIQFLVKPGEKTVRMLAVITADQETLQADPRLRQMLVMEADLAEKQVRRYAQRFGFDVERRDPQGP
jgi:hypothetical protein